MCASSCLLFDVPLDGAFYYYYYYYLVKGCPPPRDRTAPQAAVSLSSEVHDVTEKESRRGEEIVPRPHLLLVVWKHQ